MEETIGFTGTRNPSAALCRRAEEVVTNLLPSTRIVTGACLGIDAVIARAACCLGRSVHTVVPADRSRVDPDWRRWCITFEEMPEGTDYRARNERIVALSDGMIAFPEAPEDAPQSRRSGTWMTVRIARRAGVPVLVEKV